MISLPRLNVNIYMTRLEYLSLSSERNKIRKGGYLLADLSLFFFFLVVVHIVSKEPIVNHRYISLFPQDMRKTLTM